MPKPIRTEGICAQFPTLQAQVQQEQHLQELQWQQQMRRAQEKIREQQLQERQEQERQQRELMEQQQRDLMEQQRQSQQDQQQRRDDQSQVWRQPEEHQQQSNPEARKRRTRTRSLWDDDEGEPPPNGGTSVNSQADIVADRSTVNVASASSNPPEWVQDILGDANNPGRPPPPREEQPQLPVSGENADGTQIQLHGSSSPYGTVVEVPNTEELVKGLINTPEQSAAVRDQQRFLLISGKKGGKGIPLEDWLCKCGFKNTYRNTICGGNGGVGCKVERVFGQVPGLGMAGGAQSGAPVNTQGYNQVQTSKLKSVPCRFYEMGRCSKGDMCPFFHNPSLDTAAILAAKGGKGTLVPGCLFLPRISDGLEAYHLQAYFSQFGKIISVYGPIKKPIGAIGYVRFEEPSTAEKVLALGEDHYVRGDLYVRAEQSFEQEGKGKKGKDKDFGKGRIFSEELKDSHGGERQYSFGSGGLQVSYRSNPYNTV